MYYYKIPHGKIVNRTRSHLSHLHYWNYHPFSTEETTVCFIYLMCIKCKYFPQIRTAASQRYAQCGYLACQWIHSFFIIPFLPWHHAIQCFPSHFLGKQGRALGLAGIVTALRSTGCSPVPVCALKSLWQHYSAQCVPEQCHLTTACESNPICQGKVLQHTN